MRQITFLFALIVMLITVGVAGAQMSIPDELPMGLTIDYWHEWDGAQAEAMTLIIDDFNSNNEWDITVEQVYQGNTGGLIDQLSTGIVSGELPNLSGAVFSNNAMGYYLDGVLVPLDAYLDHPVWGFDDMGMENLNHDLLAINRVPFEPFNGQLLAWPVGMSANVLSVNLGMLAGLGMDGPPTDLASFREAACAANELSGAAGEDVQGFPLRTNDNDLYSFIVANGGYIYDEMAGAYSFSNEKSVEVLQFFQDLYSDGCAYIPDGPYVNTADFAFALNPMAVGSSVGVPFIKNDIEASGSDIEWVNTTVPWSGDNRTLQVYQRSMGLYVSSPENQLATWLFLKHLASPASQVTWTEYAQYQPYTRAGLEGLSDAFLADNPQFNSIREVLLDSGTKLWSEPVLVGSDRVGPVVQELIANITTGGQDVMEAAIAAEIEANELIAEALEEMG